MADLATRRIVNSDSYLGPIQKAHIKALVWLPGGQLSALLTALIPPLWRDGLGEIQVQKRLFQIWETPTSLYNATFAWSPNGRYLGYLTQKSRDTYFASYSLEDSEVRVRDGKSYFTGSSSCEHEASSPPYLLPAQFASLPPPPPDDPHTAYGPQDHINTKDGNTHLELPPLNVLAWSPDSQYIASSRCQMTSSEQTICIWRINSENRTIEQVEQHKSHRGAITALAWSPDGKHVAFANRDGTLQIWTPVPHALILRRDEEAKRLNEERAKVLNKYPQEEGRVNRTTRLRPGQLFLRQDEEKKRLDEAIDSFLRREDIYLYPAHGFIPMYRLAWSPDGRFIASASRERDAPIQIWHVPECLWHQKEDG